MIIACKLLFEIDFSIPSKTADSNPSVSILTSVDLFNSNKLSKVSTRTSIVFFSPSTAT